MAKDKKDTKRVAMTGAERMKKYRADPKNKYKADLDNKKRTVRRQLAKLKQKSDNSEGTLRVVLARKYKRQTCRKKDRSGWIVLSIFYFWNYIKLY